MDLKGGLVPYPEMPDNISLNSKCFLKAGTL